MRFPFAPMALILLLCSPADVPAVEAEGSADLRGLNERIDNPDLSRAFSFKDYKYMGSRDYRTSEFRTKPFHFVDKFRDKTFATKSYYTGKSAASKGSRFTNRKFQTSEARIDTDRVIENIDFEFVREQYGTREFHAAGREFRTKENADSGREFEGRGTRQEILDQQQPSAPGMTIDQVRDLLNKSK